MPLFPPSPRVMQMQTNLGATAGTTNGTAVATGGTASTKGSVVELITSTSFDVYWITIIASNYGLAATASEGALDILSGTAGSEQVVIPNLLMGYAGGDVGAATCGPRRWDFPLYFAAGARLSAQTAGARVTSNCYVTVLLYGGAVVPPFRVGSTVTTYGMGTVPNGTTITSGASGAEGAWTQITASTTADHFALMPSFQPQGDVGLSNAHYNVDVAVGAAASEHELGNWTYTHNVQEQMGGPWNSWPVFQEIPSGSRLSLRASCSTTTSSGYGAVIHAVS